MSKLERKACEDWLAKNAILFFKNAKIIEYETSHLMNALTKYKMNELSIDNSLQFSV
jgi:hypothetical protein